MPERRVTIHRKPLIRSLPLLASPRAMLISEVRAKTCAAESIGPLDIQNNALKKVVHFTDWQTGIKVAHMIRFKPAPGTGPTAFRHGLSLIPATSRSLR